jgi:folate-binding protein YgfZ
MIHESPLRAAHEAYVQSESARQAMPAAAHRPGAATGQRLARAVQYIPYGANASSSAPACELAADFGSVEVEYAAIRRGAAIMDCPHRGTLMVTGDPRQRREFLNRMLTQELKHLEAGHAAPSFWLNRKGRIDADLLLIELGDRMLIDVDINQAASAARSLSAFIVMENVEIEDVSAKFHHVAVHGRRASEAIAAVCRSDESGRLSQFTLDEHRATSLSIANTPITIARRDQAGEPGFELIIPIERTINVWNALLQIRAAPFNDSQSTIQNQVRPLGWHAFNSARIEAGTPLFNIDFGPTNLPHETGILHQRVSFTKGCYLGQEIVARMENLGKPRQSLVGLRMKDDLLPTAGEQVFALKPDESMGDEIGVVTSSTLSPMLGAAPIAFAMIKTTHAAEGSVVLVNAEGAQTQANVSPLRFWHSEARSQS